MGSARPSEGTAGIAGKRASVLVVEDEFLLRVLLADELRAHGFTVLEAANAEEALDLLDRGAQVALLLTDIRMPGAFDGAELVRRVRALYPHLMIAVTSAHCPEHEIGSEVDDFFPKPYDAPKLARQVRAILR